jgi:hypothetical protein
MPITINGSTGISGVDGSAATPALQGGDTNTGIVFGTDTVGVSTGGVQRTTVDSSGRVGIGTTTPAWIHEVYKDTSSGSVGVYPASVINNPNASGYSAFYHFSGTTNKGGLEYSNSANILKLGAASQLTFCTNGVDTERMRITSVGEVKLNTGVPIIVPYAYATTTTNAANVFVATDGNIFRSTSSRRWKTDIEDLQPAFADQILNCRPVWYRSTSDKDNPEWGYWGFIAEEVAEVDPRLVFWKTHDVVKDEDGNESTVQLEEPLAEGVQYDRFVPHLLNLIKRQGEAIADLQAKVAALEAS